MSQSRSYYNVDDAVCRFYESKNGCLNGKQCPYKHVESGRYTEKTMIVPINSKAKNKEKINNKNKVISQNNQASNLRVTTVNYTNGGITYPAYHIGGIIPLQFAGNGNTNFIPIIASSPTVSYQQINNNIYYLNNDIDNNSNYSYNSSSNKSNDTPPYYRNNNNMNINTPQRSKMINGTVFYNQKYDKLDDYKECLVDPSAFIYNITQRTLICGECDFSFTVDLIRKRGGIGCGNNICSTSWYYYKKQWYHGIPKEIGYQLFGYFLQNLKFCKDNNVKVSFGIDAKLLKPSQQQWNKIGADKFDRIIFTFPRTYKEREHHKWAKIKYNVDNERMLYQVLKSMKSMLSEDGEIHIMLLKGQFCNWNVKKMLNELDLEVSYWTELDEMLLRKHFKAFIPRDGYGNPMKLDGSNMHFISMKMKARYTLTTESLVIH